MKTRLMMLLLVLLACVFQGQAVEFMFPEINIVSELKDLRTLVEGLTAKLNATERELDKLKKESDERPKVAFTASMLSSQDKHHGPFDAETNLIFGKVLTNIGDAYNPITAPLTGSGPTRVCVVLTESSEYFKGIFTAPVRGVYYFRFSGYGYSGRDMGLSIFKGSTRVVSSYEHRSGDQNDNTSNGVTLQLDTGDVVYMRLWINSWVFVDRRYDYCTFSGFLLYPM